MGLNVEMRERDVDSIAEGRVDYPGTVPVVWVGVGEVRALNDSSVGSQCARTYWNKGR